MKDKRGDKLDKPILYSSQRTKLKEVKGEKKKLFEKLYLSNRNEIGSKFYFLSFLNPPQLKLKEKKDKNFQ